MEKKKFYCLILNNYPNSTVHYVSGGEKITVIDGVVKKNCINLEELEDIFMELDEKIIERKGYWEVEGSFPVFAEEREGKMYDLITGEEIAYSKKPINGPTLTYKEKVLANDYMMYCMLELLGEEGKVNYQRRLNEIKHQNEFQAEDKYYYVNLIKTHNDRQVIAAARYTKGKMVDLITEEVLEEYQEEMITEHATYAQKARVTKEIAYRGINKKIYESTMKAINTESVFEYNTYKRINKQNSSKVRSKKK